MHSNTRLCTTILSVTLHFRGVLKTTARNPAEKQTLSSEMHFLLEKHAIEEVESEQQNCGFYSNLFSGGKKGQILDPEGV